MTYVINRRKETAHRIRGLPFYAMNTQWLLCAIFLMFWNIFAQYSKSVLHFSPLCDKIVSIEPGQTTKKESLYLKGILALLLVVVIAATALNIPALAYSMNEDGYYKGKYYSGTINCVHCYATATFRWNDTRYPLKVDTLLCFIFDDNPTKRIPHSQSKVGYKAVSDMNDVKDNRDQTAVCAYLDGYIGQVPVINGLCSWAPALPKS